jgi:hypothetical protein
MSLLADSLQKQEVAEGLRTAGRDTRGRFAKGRSGNPAGCFRKGRSGNPAGRRAGVRNRATETAELLLDGEAEALTRKVIELALAGDGAALRLCLDRIIPPRRQRPTKLRLPPVTCAADLGATMATITNAVTAGLVTAAEAADLAHVVEIFVRAVETSDFDRRLTEVEESTAAAKE